MIQFTDIIVILGESFFGGNTDMAGVVLLVAVLVFLLAFSKKLVTTLLLAVPIIMMFAFVGALPSDIGLVMLVIVALAIASQAKGAFS